MFTSESYKISNVQYQANKIYTVKWLIKIIFGFQFFFSKKKHYVVTRSGIERYFKKKLRPFNNFLGAFSFFFREETKHAIFSFTCDSIRL